MQYSELKDLIADYLHRSDLVNTIPSLIALAHARINRDLYILDMETRATANLSDVFVDLPTDFKELISVQYTGTTRQMLKQFTPEQMDTFYPTSNGGPPRAYCLHGSSLEIRPIPGEEYTVEITYYAYYDALSADEDTNWVLTNVPSIYVYATMLEAAPFLEHDERMKTWADMYKEERDRLNEESERSRFSGSPLQIKSLTTDTP